MTPGDTLTVSGGTNVTTAMAGDTLTINATDTNTTYTAGDGLDLGGKEFSLDLKNNSGGLLDTGIPNYVYRWTEREIIKTIKSYDPSNITYVKFNYANDLTNVKSNKLYIKILIIFAKIYFFIFKKQQNCLSIFIDKTKIEKRFN